MIIFVMITIIGEDDEDYHNTNDIIFHMDDCFCYCIDVLTDNDDNGGVYDDFDGAAAEDVKMVIVTTVI